jgi:myo-inositol-1(or 4)-monophosphatase
MSAPTPETLLEVAVAAALAAGSHARDHRARRDQAVVRTEHDVKLKLDIECQEMAERTIRKAFPDHFILGEEKTEGSLAQANAPRDSSIEWVVDPIDGTVNFSHGLPFWCSSIACRRDGETVAGAVFAPDLGQMYQASLDTPALCNGEPIAVSAVDTLSRAMILSSTDLSPEPGAEPLRVFRKIAVGVQKARILGAAALDLCMVAAGKADGYLETRIFLWDVAAGELIVRRAGGRTRRLRPMDQEHRMAFMATNGRIDAALDALLGEGRG